MTTYVFRCQTNDARVEARLPMKAAPSIGESIDCRCDEAEYRPHSMKRVIGPVSFGEVKGTGNGPIGRGLMDRAEVGRKRRANWK